MRPPPSPSGRRCRSRQRSADEGSVELCISVPHPPPRGARRHPLPQAGEGRRLTSFGYSMPRTVAEADPFEHFCNRDRLAPCLWRRRALRAPRLPRWGASLQHRGRADRPRRFRGRGRRRLRTHLVAHRRHLLVGPVRPARHGQCLQGECELEILREKRVASSECHARRGEQSEPREGHPGPVTEDGYPSPPDPSDRSAGYDTVPRHLVLAIRSVISPGMN